MNDERNYRHTGGRSLVRTLAKAPIQFYRKVISPLKPPTCRFYPTCSQYALQSIDVHGVWKGSYLAVRRILKCHPFHPGGIDHVPPRKDKLGSEEACCGHSERIPPGDRPESNS